MLKGKTVVVTGGSRGIGAAIARHCAQCGANVAVVYAGRADAAQETVANCEKLGVRAKAYQCDVSDFEAAKNLVASIVTDFGSVWGLVNNAGVTCDKLLLRMSEADFDRVLAVNLKGSFNMIKHLTPVLLRAKEGRIVNLSSVVGLMGNAGQVNYAASKAGVVGMTKSVARELASRSITCNAVAPGFIDTDMTAKLTDDQQAAIRAGIPLGTIGTVDDVAATVAFLLGAGARYITGEVIKVDGGLYI